MEKITLIIVDDHQLFRNGLKFIINDFSHFEVVGEASNGMEMLDLLKQVNPDIVLLDINMPIMNGIEASRKALEMFPNLKILVLSMYGEEEYYNTMIEIGVKGFILKDADNEELRNALIRIAEGHSYFSQELLLKLLRTKKIDEVLKLTKREKEILTLICQGNSNQQISEILHISPRTVERHRSELLQKTESDNSISMVIFAIKNRLVNI
jgi:DNA-binding NarL/FixJ family response regulator